MPIYAYRCASCGHAKDVLQKISDPLLTMCPACNVDTFQKQVTAAGFQLKGSGWYVTDFRGGEKGGEGANSGIATAPKPENASSDTTAAPAVVPTVAPAAPVSSAPAPSAPVVKAAAAPAAPSAS